MSAPVKYRNTRIEKFKSIQLVFLSLIVVFFIGCNDDDDGPSEFDFPLEGSTLAMADIAGNWTATSAEFQIVGDPGSFVEIVGQGGSVTLNIQSNGRFTSIISFPGAAPEQFSGQLGFSGNQLVLLDDVDEPGDEAFIDITLTPQDELLLSGVLEFDDGTGSFVPTNVNLSMIR